MGEWVAILSALNIAVIIGAALNFVLQRRRRSGQIDTSEARQLWAESSTLRQELFAQLERMRMQLDTVRAENVALQAELIKLRTDYADCTHRLRTAIEKLEENQDE